MAGRVQNRRAHALELRRLNGLSLPLTERAIEQSGPGHHEKELTLRRQQRQRKELGNHRDAAADGKDE